MIDLHLHTTASDGALSAAELVARAQDKGLTTIAVTDHDSMAAVPELEALTREAGLDFVSGIEITTLWGGRDVHVLAYFLDWRSPRVAGLLSTQGRARTERARRIGDRLKTLGVALDVEELITAIDPRAIGRPAIAKALVDAGYVPDVQAAFDEFLAHGAAAWVTHVAEAPHDIIRFIEGEGGLASFAHPGVTAQDELLDELAGDGLHAVEVYHPEHSADDTARYLAFARRRGLLVTGGSDYHGEHGRRPEAFGSVVLPDDEFRRMLARQKARPSAGALNSPERPRP
jgi:predicted metal-dependent phosphoesterase TrpH